MRCLLKVSIPVETGNATISDGSLPKTIESILGDLKPEATYFTDDNGKRTGLIIFDLKDTAQIPAVAEPWFLAFNAHIELHPVMTLEDLKKATPVAAEGIIVRQATVFDLRTPFVALSIQRSPDGIASHVLPHAL
jgi:hypothetical protein